MSRVTFTVRLPPHTRWTDEAARSLVGQSVPVKVGDEVVVRATVVAAAVADDGCALRLTIDGPGTLLAAVQGVEPSIGGAG